LVPTVSVSAHQFSVFMSLNLPKILGGGIVKVEVIGSDALIKGIKINNKG